MKLNPSQLATIETYLLSWELQFRDFYDEMFDHFCSEIEHRMSGGTSFENALAETSYLFSDYEYGTPPAMQYYGLQAYEMEWFAKFKRKNNELIISELKRQIFSPSLFIWGVIYFVLYQIHSHVDIPALWVFMMIPSVIILVLTQLKLSSGREFSWKIKFFIKNFRNAGIHQSKDSLFARPHTLVHQTNLLLSIFMISLNTPFDIIRLFNGDKVVSSIYNLGLSCVFLTLAFAIYKVTDVVIKQEKKRENTFLIDRDQLT